MFYTVASQSYIGGRVRNEDRVAVAARDGAVLLLVADGIDGYEGGSIAAQALVDAMVQSFERTPVEQLADPAAFLQLAIGYSHSVIRRRAIENKLPPHVPKTPCVACLISGGVAHWAHAGDSRLYLYRDGRMAYRTEDHSGGPAGGVESNTISRCVGGHARPIATIGPKVQLEDNDMIIICSDGTWRNIESADVMKHIVPEQPQNGLDNLLRALELRNQEPSDNISAVVLCWGANYTNDRKKKEQQLDLLGDSTHASQATHSNTPTIPADSANKKSENNVNENVEPIQDELEPLASKLESSSGHQSKDKAQSSEDFDSMIEELENFVEKLDKSL
jgi:serine/threonine protein phosphatase PrpC